MYYKLGSQLDIYDDYPEGQEKFEWNLCLLSDKYGIVHSYVFLGTRTTHDPIVKLARNLVDQLNKENKSE